MGDIVIKSEDYELFKQALREFHKQSKFYKISNHGNGLTRLETIVKKITNFDYCGTTGCDFAD